MIDSIAVETSPAEPSADTASRIALLQAIADPVRWSILDWLAEGTRCVCELREHVPVAGNLLSYHLRVLRETGLVTTARRGRWIDYSLADDAATRLNAALPARDLSSR